MKKFLSAIVVAAAACVAGTGAANAGPIFVGSWAVADGPVWTTNPQVMSAVETAAFLFGGTASDYAISTIDNNPLNINHLAHVDGWADPQYLTGTVAETYSLSSNGGGYNAFPAYSAYVFDHACGIYYCVGGGGQNAINFAFRITDVPEPLTLSLFGVGFAGAVAMRRRKKAA